MRLSRVLRLYRFDRSSDAVRIKALLVGAAALMGFQLINFAFLFYMLGPRWDYGAVIIVGFVSTLCLLLSYRYHQKFYIAGIGFAVIMFGMIYFAANVTKAGVDSALLPLIPVTILMSGIISGWRMTLITGLLGLLFSLSLFYQTAMFTGDGTIVLAMTNPVYINKIVQLILGCVMASIIGASLSLAMHGLFTRDEQNIEKIRKAERQRTAFLSSLSHEIRTPLNGIIGMSGLMLKTELTGQQRQYADIVSKCSENLMEVMGTVMEFSQINNARIVLNPGVFDLHQLVHSLVKKYAASLAENSDVILGLHIAEEVPQYLEADAKRLELVINHLLRNAVHFTPEGSINLLVNGQTQADAKFRLCVFVRDTGVGIRQSELKDIYKPFHQLDNRLSREHEGTGLGLSLCKEIIEYMNGKLDVVSEFGAGSTFFFELTLPVISSDDVDIKSINPQLADAHDLSNIAVFKRTG